VSGVIVQEVSQGRLVQIINAQEAVWQSGSNEWLFSNGIIYLLADSGEYKHLIKFDQQSLAIKYTPADFFVGERNPDEMNTSQLREYIALKEKMGTEVVSYQIQLNMKLAIPFASLVFALLGAPLGISRRRASGSVGLGISIIVIFLYYIAIFISMALGEIKLVPPVLAAWLPNFAAGIAGWRILKQAGEN
jgi:lipopolysaccharide export system permease protein